MDNISNISNVYSNSGHGYINYEDGIFTMPMTRHRL